MDWRATQIAINTAKTSFQTHLEAALNLVLVPGPLLLQTTTNLNDHLAGESYKAVSFWAESLEEPLEIVQSLAKWKRYALGKYQYPVHSGIYVDMKAIRAHETLDQLHSLFVDQWDWELIILPEERTLDYLKATVNKIYAAICKTQLQLQQRWSHLKAHLPEALTFFTAQELEDAYPNDTFETITNQVVRTHGAVFIMQIGHPLRSGRVFDTRSAEYDDWTLNGDLFFWSETIQQAVEISSMGIRVDAAALVSQAQLNQMPKPNQQSDNPYFSAVLNNALPITIGGGIGQARLLMFLLEKQHIGEVQVAPWDGKTTAWAQKHQVKLL